MLYSFLRGETHDSRLVMCGADCRCDMRATSGRRTRRRAASSRYNAEACDRKCQASAVLREPRNGRATGHEGGSGSFALDSNGRLNWQLIRDNAHVGIHEMTVTGKALTQAMYGAAPKYSYFNGCSTGGRQGLMEAQRYPQDYNGIVAGAPAINWTRFIPQEMWGAIAMNAANNPIPGCKLAAATAAAITACDAIDGVKDGVIED